MAFKYRIHDARIGRFLSIDPLFRDYPWNSPYAFSENRVIDKIEFEGLEMTDAYLMWNPPGLSPEETEKYQSRQKDVVLDVTSSAIKPFVVVGSGVFAPLIGNIADGVTKGDYPSWATPYTVDKWEFIPKPEWLDGLPWDDGGKEVLQSTASVVLTFAPLSEASYLPEKIAKTTFLKSSIKLGLDLGLDCISDETYMRNVDHKDLTGESVQELSQEDSTIETP